MQKIYRLFSLIAVATLIFTTACATQPPMGAPPQFDIQPIQAGQWAAKANQLYFIIDASASMEEPHAGQTKFETAKGVVDHFNQTMPDLEITTALRGFGLSPSISNQGTVLFHGPKEYSREGLAEGLKSIARAGGSSPLAKALKAAGADFEKSTDTVAMVIISDGKDMAKAELLAAAALASQMADRLCLYTVLAGKDPAGQALLQQIAATAECGGSTTADSLASGAEMAEFVKKVILTKQPDSDGDGVPDAADRCPDTAGGVQVNIQGCPLDSDGDGDGVNDDLDKCPGTPADTKVNAKGCPPPKATKSAKVTQDESWIYGDIQFEKNSDAVKAASIQILDEIVEGLKEQPELKLEVQGHSDGTGPAAYNQLLSEKRADSIRKYLIEKGVAAERLTSKGYGPTRPVASNDTAEGRALNRRVEFKPIE